MKIPRPGTLLGLVVACLLCSAAFGVEFQQRLLNLSERASVGTGESILIAGFVIGGDGHKPVLIRAIGPTLSKYGVPNPLPNPTLRLFNSSGLEIANNSGWSSDPTKTAALTAAFASTGAFALNTGTLDAAMIVSLGSGAYTAQVTGAGTSTGEALLEIYDLEGAPRLINLSARAVLDTKTPMMISGLSVGNNSVRTVLVRAAGPALRNYGVSSALNDPVLEVRDVKGATLMSNNNWEDGGKGPTVAAAAAKAWAFPFAAGSKDAALIIELNPGLYTVMISGYDGGTGIALAEVYDLTPEMMSTVNVTASIASADSGSKTPGRFTFTRTGDITQSVTVGFTLSGSAVAGADYSTLPTQVTFPAGLASVSLDVNPSAGDKSELVARTLTLSLSNSSVYGLGDNRAASVLIFHSASTLHLASMRPASAALGSSIASGTASIQLAPDRSYALVSCSFSNLSSAEVTAHLVLGGPSDEGVFVLGLPQGQFSGFRWDFKPSGNYSAEDLVQALLKGRIYISIDSANYPAGELRGQFIVSAGSFTFSTPASPPPLTDTPLSAAQASRFLSQATFGPTQAEIDALTGARLSDLRTWITAQVALPASSHRSETMADFTANTQSATVTKPVSANRLAAWWKHSLRGQDQLRQRVAFALSQLFVVSEQNNAIGTYQEGMANYYDLLARGAFGNYRSLLEEVARSPIMGYYLSHLRNRKADPKTGAQPDENFAREIMQLFSIGLVQLQPDGSVKLSADALTIPTYDNSTITEVAKVFTGFSFYTTNTATTSFSGGPADYLNPMSLFPTYHEDSAKTIVTGRILPAGQGGLKDLSDMLDTLANHPNTGPFVSKQLIQRLVSSNPSPGYVYRVASVFNDNGAGVRGDLAAVVSAILLDYEARSDATAASPGFGKLREPLLRTTALLRAFSADTGTGRLAITNAYSNLNEGPLQSPTVFNFYEPGYVLPGELAEAGLVAPEYQILTGTTAITVPNYLYSFLTATRSATTVGLDLSSLTPLARQPEQLVAKLDVLFCHGGMSPAMRASIVGALNAAPTSTSDLDRVRTAIYLTVNSPEAAIQK